MNNISDIDVARRRRVASRFCFACRRPWMMQAVRQGDTLVIRCRSCGHVRTSIPSGGEHLADPVVMILPVVQTCTDETAAAP
jgi:hypothetical protein